MGSILTRPTMAANMKTIFTAALLIGLCGVANAADKVDPVGTWKCEYAINDQKRTSTLKITKDGDKLDGTMSWPDQKEVTLQDVKLKEGDLTFTAERMFMDNKILIEYKFTITGDKFKGTGAAEFGDKKQEFAIEGMREKKDK